MRLTAWLKPNFCQLCDVARATQRLYWECAGETPYLHVCETCPELWDKVACQHCGAWRNTANTLFAEQVENGTSVPFGPFCSDACLRTWQLLRGTDRTTPPQLCTWCGAQVAYDDPSLPP